MKNIYYTLLCCTCLFTFSCCNKNIHPSDEPTVPTDRYDTLLILSTNDVHAHIDNMAKEKAYIDRMKKEYSKVLVISAGDIFTGSPVVDQYPERGYPMIDLMNRLGYKIMAIGNHDFDYGQTVLNERLIQANFPALCANADFSQTILSDKIKPYKIISVNGLKVALVGFVQRSSGNGIPATAPGNVANIIFSDALTNYSKYNSLRDSGEVFVVVSHLGIDADRILAQRFSAPDVIIGGHSHTRLEPAETINGVLITQAGGNLSYIGKTILYLKNGVVERKINVLVPTNTLTVEDTDIKTEIVKYNDNPSLGRVIGRATANFSGKEALGNLMTDAVTDQFNLDMAFTNNGGIRISYIPQGNITLSKIYELDPFGNDVVVFDLSLSEVETLLKYTCRSGFINLQISGAKYVYNKTTKKITLTDYNNQPLSATKTYKVGMNSYVAETEMINALPTAIGTYMYTTTAGTLVNYIEQEQEVTPQAPRATIVQ